MLFEKTSDYLSTISDDRRFIAEHLKNAINQLSEGDSRQSTKERAIKYSGLMGNEDFAYLHVLLNEGKIPTMDVLGLVEMSMESGVPMEFLTQAYSRAETNGMDRAKTLIEAAKKSPEPTAVAADSDDESEVDESDWDTVLTKLDTPEELQKIANKIDSFDDIIHHYTDDELVVKLDEHLSREARIRKKVEFAKGSARRDAAKKIALKRLSSAPKIKQKARRQAIEMLKERLAKKPVSELSVADKERLEDILLKRKDLIARLANKIAPKIRKIEQARLDRSRMNEDAGPKGQSSDSEDKEEFIEIGPDGKEVLRKHSPEAIFDNGGVQDPDYQTQ